MTLRAGAFADIKDTAALLGTNLGSDEQPRFTKAEITKAETFQFFKEKPTQHWHANRHGVAQGFLDRFVRQIIAEIDEIRSEEIPVDIQLRPAERAIYLELDLWGPVAFHPSTTTGRYRCFPATPLYVQRQQRLQLSDLRDQNSLCRQPVVLAGGGNDIAPLLTTRPPP